MAKLTLMTIINNYIKNFRKIFVYLHNKPNLFIVDDIDSANRLTFIQLPQT